MAGLLATIKKMPPKQRKSLRDLLNGDSMV